MAGNALRTLAADPACRAAFLSSPALRELFHVPASRYVVSTSRDALWPRLETLRVKGYRVGVEFVGEEATDSAEIELICQEYLALVAETPDGLTTQLGFDLSNVGLLVDRELALENTARIVAAAATRDMPVMISMERSTLVDSILGVFHELAPLHWNLGLTLQAHLHRTSTDLDEVARLGCPVRLVKGAYREAASVALDRSPALTNRYADLVEALLERGVRPACGTHDAMTLSLLGARGLLDEIAEVEMLHGVQPELLRTYRERGTPCRVATVYGTNWWLHFLHRLAEHPPAVVTALADVAHPERVRLRCDY